MHKGFTYTFAMEVTKETSGTQDAAFYPKYAPYSYELERLASFPLVLPTAASGPKKGNQLNWWHRVYCSNTRRHLNAKLDLGQ